MNKSRKEKIQHAYDILTEAREEEEISYENLPENLHYSTKGEEMSENIENLNEALCALENIIFKE